MKIGNKTLRSKTYIIAEFGVNHNGSLDRAKQGIKEAAMAGADAIKFQTYTADELVVKGTPKFWDAKVDKHLPDQHAAYKALEGFKDEWYPELIQTCKDFQIEFLSTPFSMEGADFLNKLGMKAFKVASSDMSCIPYLEHIAKFNKPILLSTGAATMEEVEEAVETIRKYHDKIVVMHCTLAYPTPTKDANFLALSTLKKKFPDLVIGLSDHTLGPVSTVIGSIMGADVVEKHFTVDKLLPESADHWLSVDGAELSTIVELIRYAEDLKGTGGKRVLAVERDTRMYDKRSIVSRGDIKKGDVFTEENITYKRPGTGIHPRDYKKVLGSTAAKDIKDDTTLEWAMIQS